jgi:hypothetical protein
MKQFSYAGFRHKRQFRTLTGVTPAVFQTMILNPAVAELRLRALGHNSTFACCFRLPGGGAVGRAGGL